MKKEQVIEKLRSFNREKSIKRAESREKMLEKMTPVDKPVTEQKSMHFSLVPEKESGKDVLRVENFGKSFPVQDMFDGTGERSEDAKLVLGTYKIACPYRLAQGDILRRRN